MLRTGLKSQGFKESVVDPYVFLRNNMIVLCYVDDCILLSPSKGVIEEFILSLKNGPENFVFSDEGAIYTYLGVKFSKLDDGSGLK